MADRTPTPEEIRDAVTTIENLRDALKAHLERSPSIPTHWGYLRVLEEQCDQRRHYLSAAFNHASRLRDVADAIERGDIKNG